MTPTLSQYIVGVDLEVITSSCSRLVTQLNFTVAVVIAQYSDLLVDLMIDFYFLKLQLIGFTPRKTT